MHDTERPHASPSTDDVIAGDQPPAEQTEKDPADDNTFPAYEPSGDGSLREGELLSNVIQAHLDVTTLEVGAELTMNLRTHPYAVVLTQDCDLMQDFAVRESNAVSERSLPNMLLCEVNSEDELHRSVQRSGLGSKEWRALRQNKLERYQFLESVPPHCDAATAGLPAMGIDFKRYFTVPLDELYFRVDSGETLRRCRLIGSYVQHLRIRFFNFQSRVALPRDHRTE